MRITEIARVRLSKDPDDFGAYVNDSGKAEKTVLLPVKKLTTFEPDEKFNNPKAQQYLRKMVLALKSGKELPPILVRKQGTAYQVVDGHHRFMAYKMSGKKEIPVRIVAKTNVKEL